MLPGLVLALREGLEAALIVGILLGVLRKLERADRERSVWWGAAAAALLSVLVAVGLTAIGAELEGRAEALFEGLTLLLAAGVLTWMIFWMQRQGRSVRQGLEAQVRQAIAGEPGRGLFTVSFVAVSREGIELALFMTAAAVTSSARQTWMGGVLGLALAAALGWAVFASTVRLDVRRFFQVTGAILLVFAAGLVARSVHEFIELGWLPALVEHIWNTASILSDESALGQVATSLLGYRSSPALSEVIGYVIYLAVVLGLLWWTSRSTAHVVAGTSHGA
jgi:high-affinity iron transporter